MKITTISQAEAEVLLLIWDGGDFAMDYQINLEDVNIFAERLLAQYKPGVKFTHISRAKDSHAPDKVYDAFIIDTEHDGRFIIKLDSSGYESLVYTQVFSQCELPTPTFFGRVEDTQHRWWFLIRYVNGFDIVQGNETGFLEVAIELAKIHSHFFGREVELSIVNANSQRIARQLAFLDNDSSKDENSISSALQNSIKFAGHRLNSRPQTLIHNDLLPINILKDDTGVNFIDWANAAFGCYAHDIGRLLGDLKDERGEHWVKEDWHHSILLAYYENISLPDGTLWNWAEFQVDFLCACLWNHAEIVLAHLMRGWVLGRWYEVNLGAIAKYSDMLVTLGVAE